MRRLVWCGIAFLGLVSPPLGWWGTDRLESDNAFCVSCHLTPGVPLHEQKAERFERQPAEDLAAAHASAEPGFLCADCHRGTSFIGRLRVKAVAARDTVQYLLGRFEEPARMRHPLWDQDCARCHRSFRADSRDDFHGLETHNVRLGYGCVECHQAHTTGAPSELHFLNGEMVLPICRNCHKEF